MCAPIKTISYFDMKLCRSSVFLLLYFSLTYLLQLSPWFLAIDQNGLDSICGHSFGFYLPYEEDQKLHISRSGGEHCPSEGTHQLTEDFHIGTRETYLEGIFEAQNTRQMTIYTVMFGFYQLNIPFING